MCESAICCAWRHLRHFGSYFGYRISFIPSMSVLGQVRTDAWAHCTMQNWQENWRTKRIMHPVAVAAREIAKSNLVQFAAAFSARTT